MKVLILSILKRHNADNPVNVLKEYMEEHIDNCIVAIEDMFKYVSPMICDLVSKKLTRQVSTNLIDKKKFDSAHVNEHTMDNYSIMLEDIILSKLSNLIERFAPDVLVCTHPYFLKLLCQLRRNSLYRVPVLALIIGFSLEDSWAYKYVDAYAVTYDEMKLRLIDMGVNADRIFPLGIPVSPRYFLKYNKRSLLDSLSLQDKPTVLLAGMSPYMASNRKILSSIIDSPEDFQIIIAAENNERFRNQAVHIAKNCKKNIQVFGNTDMLPELMALSSIMITYPSSQVISEAMASGLPFAFLASSSNLYKQNSDFYLREGLGIQIDNTAAGIAKVLNLLNNDAGLKEIGSRVQTIVKPHASSQIAELIERLPTITPAMRQR